MDAGTNGTGNCTVGAATKRYSSTGSAFTGAGQGWAAQNGNATWLDSKYNTSAGSATAWANAPSANVNTATYTATNYIAQTSVTGLDFCINSPTSCAMNFSSAGMISDVQAGCLAPPTMAGIPSITALPSPLDRSSLSTGGRAAGVNDYCSGNVPVTSTFSPYNGESVASLPADAQYAPELTIDYTPESSPVPEPASLTLAGLGLLSFAAKFRNRFARKSEV